MRYFEVEAKQMVHTRYLVLAEDAEDAINNCYDGEFIGEFGDDVVFQTFDHYDKSTLALIRRNPNQEIHTNQKEITK